MRRTHLIVAALAAAVFALAPASARAQNEKLDISAFAINMSNIATGSTAVVQINIDSWSTPEEREMLITTMVEKKPDDLLKALQKLPKRGFFRIPMARPPDPHHLSLGIDIHYAWQTPLPDGGRRIVLAGKRNELPEKEFFDREVAPRLGRNVEYVGEADAVLKRELLAKAAVLAFPIQWEEPFGIVMAEALASGTPVAAFNRGSVPEVVTPGKTGIIVEDISEFPGALEAALDLDPAACRADAVARFDIPVMAEGYVRTYRAAANTAAIGTRASAAMMGAPPLEIDEAQLA